MPQITFKVPLVHPTLKQKKLKPTLKQKKTKLKLVKMAKKEPRKGSFPWDLGFLFVQPMKYALIAGFIFYNRK